MAIGLDKPLAEFIEPTSVSIALISSPLLISMRNSIAVPLALSGPLLITAAHLLLLRRMIEGFGVL